MGVTELELASLEDALAAAKAESDPARARKVLLTQVIDIAVRRWGRHHGPGFGSAVLRSSGAIIIDDDTLQPR